MRPPEPDPPPCGHHKWMGPIITIKRRRCSHSEGAYPYSPDKGGEDRMTSRVKHNVLNYHTLLLNCCYYAYYSVLADPDLLEGGKISSQNLKFFGDNFLC